MSRVIPTDGESLLVETTIADIILWHDLHRLQEPYVSVIDCDRLEEWPDLFTEESIRNCGVAANHANIELERAAA